MMVSIRFEQPGDMEAIHEVNRLAFGRLDEGELVNRLRKTADPYLSLVAVDEDSRELIGHILFTPVTVTSGQEVWTALGLGPMAVRQEYQGQGIGSQLVKWGLETCLERGHDVVIVLGHPWFYPKFGFVPSRPLGITWEHEVAEEVFMVAELRPGALNGRRGVVRYHPAFDGV